MLRRTSGLVLACCVAATSLRTFAQEPPAGPTPTQIEEAKRYFEQGEALRQAGQFQAALEAYLKSRALVPRATNTLNVAVCLYSLKRYDEAYEYFEDALTKYPEAQLPPAARESAKKTMAEIEAKVGRLDVSANIDGSLVIDGRSRGKLPLLAPVRVMPGKHVVRVLRDGFATFEQTVQVAERETVRVDAKLEALTSAGRLRIEGPAELDGAEVSIDGASVGNLPWEGTLSPGTHVYLVAKGDVGTGPELAVVIAGQTVKRAVTPKPLGPERRVIVDPPTAALSIDGVAIGKGRFQGRLPVGKHVIEAREDGYVPARVPLEVTATDAADLPVKMIVDPNHPRWGSAAPKSRFAVGALFGYAFATSFGNDSTAWCREASPCEQTAAPAGPRFGLGGVYELPNGLGVYLDAGYWSLTRKMSRRFSRNAGLASSVQYDLEDNIRLSAFFVSAGLGYRIKLGESFDVAGRLMVSGARVTARDTLTGTMSDDKVSVATKTDGSGVSKDGIMVDVAPEIVLGAWIGKHVRATIGLAIPISVLRGPQLSLGETGAGAGKNCPGNPNTVHCAAQQKLDLDGMYTSSLFVRFNPQASIAYWF